MSKKTMSKEAIVPVDVPDVAMAFGGDVDLLLPDWDSIPEEFRYGSNLWNRVVSRWFFSGASKEEIASLVARPGIDKITALRHAWAILRSWRPKHQHKEAGVAYLLSLWFERGKGAAMSLPWVPESESRPWTDCPACPECSSPTGAPAMLYETPGARLQDLLCVACGARWGEVDPLAVARAWYAAGAWEGRQAPIYPPAKGKAQR